MLDAGAQRCPLSRSGHVLRTITNTAHANVDQHSASAIDRDPPSVRAFQFIGTSHRLETGVVGRRKKKYLDEFFGPGLKKKFSPGVLAPDAEKGSEKALENRQK